MTTLIWLDLPPRDAAEQMALDRGMLDVALRHEVVLVRLYCWRRDTISFGANESALRHWNRSTIDQAGLATVRRPTGGRAVWHATDDLTYSWAGLSGGHAGVRERYREVHRLLAEAISPEAALAGSPARLPGLAAGACFDVPVGGEVLLEGRKVIGSAQAAIGAGLLQHGAVAREDRSSLLAPFRTGSAPSVQSPGNATILPPVSDLAQMILTRWADDGAVPLDDPGMLAELHAAAGGHLDHFSDPAWTWRR